MVNGVPRFHNWIWSKCPIIAQMENSEPHTSKNWFAWAKSEMSTQNRRYMQTHIFQGLSMKLWKWADVLNLTIGGTCPKKQNHCLPTGMDSILDIVTDLSKQQNRFWVLPKMTRCLSQSLRKRSLFESNYSKLFPHSFVLFPSDFLSSYKV